MTVPVYVINLDADRPRWDLVQPRLVQAGLHPERLSGVDGREEWEADSLRWRSRTTWLSGRMVPFSAVGGGLSHIEAAQRFLREHPEAPYALILEDDALPLVDDPLGLVEEEVAKLPPNWSFLKLHGFGPGWRMHRTTDGGSVRQPPSWWNVSAAAYLVSRKGAEWMAGLKVRYYIDTQLFADEAQPVYRTPELVFGTREGNQAGESSNAGPRRWYSRIPVPTWNDPEAFAPVLGYKAFRLGRWEPNGAQILGILVVLMLLFLLAIQA
jgi:hypothetical protein